MREKIDLGRATIWASVITAIATILAAVLGNPRLINILLVGFALVFTALFLLYVRSKRISGFILGLQLTMMVLIASLLLALTTGMLILDRGEQEIEVEIVALLKLRLEGRLVGDNYRVTTFPSAYDLIENKSGNYYILHLGSASEHRAWFFENKEYEIDPFEDTFGDSLDAFKQELVVPLINEGIEYRLYIRGRADKDDGDDFRGDLSDPEKYGRIEYLPKMPGRKVFKPTPVQKKVPQPFTNQDLPFLRAEFLRQVLTAYSLSSEVLEGQVTTEADHEDRRATIYLFVDWPDQVVHRD